MIIWRRGGGRIGSEKALDRIGEVLNNIIGKFDMKPEGDGRGVPRHHFALINKVSELARFLLVASKPAAHLPKRENLQTW